MNSVDDMCVCKCRIKKMKNQPGYSHSHSYIEAAHTKKEDTTISIYSTKCGKVYACIRLIMTAPLQFYFVCKQKITPFIKLDAISYNTFIKISTEPHVVGGK